MQLLLLLLFVFTELAGMRDIGWDKILEFLMFSDFPSAMGMFNIYMTLTHFLDRGAYVQNRSHLLEVCYMQLLLLR